MKDEKIQKLFEFLASNEWDAKVTSRTDGVFSSSWLVSIDHPDFNSRDSQSVKVDFNTKTVKWYSASISGHNGDHYDCKTGIAPWRVIHESYDTLLAAAKTKAMRDIVKEEEKRVKANIDALATHKLKELLND